MTVEWHRTREVHSRGWTRRASNRRRARSPRLSEVIAVELR